jgi:cytochrome c553
VHQPPLWSLSISALCLAAAGCIQPDGAAAPLSGAELYRACGACHGPDALGNASLGAPSIAGMPSWYLEAQLTKFRTGLRGAHPMDLEGLRMRPMARQLMSQDEVVQVSAHVASLPRVPVPPTLDGGIAREGEASWTICQACHGPEALGNEAVKAPPLAGQADWYLLAQLKKFKGGLRGADPRDVSGGTMRPMSMTLADEAAMLNVVAYVSTLRPPR